MKTPPLLGKPEMLVHGGTFTECRQGPRRAPHILNVLALTFFVMAAVALLLL